MTEIEPVILDTDAFGLLYVHRNSPDPRVPGWQAALVGKRVLIAFQTRAELLTGALLARWGTKRTLDLRALLDATPTIQSDVDVIDAHARLTALCRQAGHGLHDRNHTADRWIAACAIAKGIPLMAGDRIYEGAPELSLFK